MGNLLLIVVLPFLIVFVLSYLLFIEKFPPYVPLFLVLASFLSVLSALILQHYLSLATLRFVGTSHLHKAMFTSFLYSATVEETSKMFFFFFSCRFLCTNSKLAGEAGSIKFIQKTNNPATRTISLLAMLFASSFAALETVGYSIYEPQLLLLRLFTATLLHILIAPLYVGMFKKKVFSSIVISIALHGTYNFLIEASNITFPFSFCVLIILLFKTIYNFRHT